MGLPRMMISLPALYRSQKGAGYAALRRQLEHNGGLSLDDAELVLWARKACVSSAAVRGVTRLELEAPIVASGCSARGALDLCRFVSGLLADMANEEVCTPLLRVWP